jgi:hypothetical protein
MDELKSVQRNLVDSIKKNSAYELFPMKKTTKPDNQPRTHFTTNNNNTIEEQSS